MGSKSPLREIVRVQRDNEISLADFSAGAEWLVVGVWRNIIADSVRNSFRLRADEIEGRADVVRTDAAARKNLLVLIHDRFVDEPEEGVVLDPVPQKFGARYGRLSATLPEGGDSRHELRGIDNASRPSFPGVGQ